MEKERVRYMLLICHDCADFCNKICHGQTPSPTNEDTKREQVARWSVFPTSAIHKSRQSQWREQSEAA
jgi:hypothetical protein